MRRLSQEVDLVRRRPEIRWHVRRRRRAHRQRGAPHRRHVRAGQQRLRRRQRPRRHHRRAPRARPRDHPRPARARDGHAPLRRRAHQLRPARHGDPPARLRRRELHRLAGRHRHRHRAHQGPHPRHPRRAASGGHGRRARSSSSPASRACSTEKDVTTLGRGGSDTTAVALAHALERRRLRDLHRRRRRLHRQPQPRGQGPQARPHLLRRDARDGGQRRAGARPALGRVRAQVRHPHPRALELHRRRGHLGHRGGHGMDIDQQWNSRSSGPSPTPPTRPRSRCAVSPTSRASRRACSPRWPTPTSTSTRSSRTPARAGTATSRAPSRTRTSRPPTRR